MIVNSVSPWRALHWIAAGWRCFASNIGAWLAMSLLFFISMAVLIIIPHIGIFLIALLWPAFCAGLLLAADKNHQGKAPQVEDIALGFQLKTIRFNLMTLGMLMLLHLLLLVLALYPLSSALYQSLYPSDHTINLGAIARQFIYNHPLILWMQSLAVISAFACFGHAIPLTVFGKVSPWRAAGLSIQAFLLNIVPISLMTLISLALLSVATFALGLGFLVVLPVLIGAHYASFREIFNLGITKGNSACVSSPLWRVS